VFTKLIGRNTTIPTRKSEVFSTAADGQTSVEIHVLQGEREMASGNKTLGRFHLDGIPPAPRGIPQVEVTFDIDANGIVHVTAKDLGTGREQRITITASSGLAKEEIEHLVREAADHAEEDRKRREAAEIRNRADNLAYQVDKTLRDSGDKVSAADRQPVEQALAQLRTALSGSDDAAIREGTTAVEQASHRFAEAMYRSTASSAAADGSPSGGPGPSGAPRDEGEVIDAEVVDGGSSGRH